MKKNVSGQVMGVQLLDVSTGLAITTGSLTIYITGDNGTQAIGSVGSGLCTHKGNGYWSYAPSQAETNYDHIAETYVHSSGINTTIQVYTNYPQTVDNNTILATLPTQAYLDGRTLASAAYFDPAADTVANVTTVATATNLTNLPTIPANWITAAGITAAALNGKGDWNVGKTGYTVSTVSDKTGYSISGIKTTLDALNDIAATSIVSAGAITTLAGAVVNVDLVDTCTTNTDMVAAAPTTAAIWAEATRTLTAGTNIVLAKGVGVTGFNDIAATDIVSAGAITTSAGNANVNIVKINGVTINGNGSTTPFDV